MACKLDDSRAGDLPEVPKADGHTMKTPTMINSMGAAGQKPGSETRVNAVRGPTPSAPTYFQDRGRMSGRQLPARERRLLELEARRRDIWTAGPRAADRLTLADLKSLGYELQASDDGGRVDLLPVPGGWQITRAEDRYVLHLDGRDDGWKAIAASATTWEDPGMALTFWLERIER